MGWFDQTPKTRGDLLEAAGKARAKGSVTRAIATYEELLEADPRDHQVHGKLAPLLAERGRFDESWASFVAAADGYLHQGFADRALAVYVQAAMAIPLKADVWEAIARIHYDRERHADAVAVLVEGARQFRHPKARPLAIRLLRRARTIDPDHFEACFELARNLARAGGREEAAGLLQVLSESAEDSTLALLRREQLRLSPGFGALSRWLGAAVGAWGATPWQPTPPAILVRRKRRSRLAWVLAALLVAAIAALGAFAYARYDVLRTSIRFELIRTKGSGR